MKTILYKNLISNIHVEENDSIGDYKSALEYLCTRPTFGAAYYSSMNIKICNENIVHDDNKPHESYYECDFHFDNPIDIIDHIFCFSSMKAKIYFIFDDIVCNSSQMKEIFLLMSIYTRKRIRIVYPNKPNEDAIIQSEDKHKFVNTPALKSDSYTKDKIKDNVSIVYKSCLLGNDIRQDLLNKYCDRVIISDYYYYLNGVIQNTPNEIMNYAHNHHS